MLPFDLLEWVVRALSFSNTIAFLWLGLTVLLNAERRVAGTWLAGSGLLLAGVFFAGHSALVGRDLGALYDLAPAGDLELWWHAAWLLFVSPPLMWYATVAWYSGVLSLPRERGWLAAVGLLGAGAALLLALAGLVPTYEEIVRGRLDSVPSFGGVPVAALVYPTYSTLCIGLALGALRRPAASKRFMGDLARRRARPWLIATSAALLVVSLSVGVAVTWLLSWSQSREVALFSKPTLTLILGFDLAISGLLGVVAALLGRAVVSYEIFTGKALPRGGLFRQWRNSLGLAAGYGALLGGSLGLPIDSTYRLVLATILMTVFYALLSWRIFLEREQGIERLRPFVVSQRLYDQLLEPSALDVDVATPFRALCDDVLGARVAYLVALGPFGPLVGPALAHPEKPPEAFDLAGLAARIRSAGTLCTPLDAGRFGGAVWAIPLWGERGLTGALLVGEKRAGGLYVQEEIEIARAVGERLIDTQAGAEMARRLMALQRERLAATQVLDQQTRRVLHDDVLPRLHAALISLSAGQQASPSDAVPALADVHRRIARLMQDLPTTLAPEVGRLGLIGALRQTADAELGRSFDGVRWQIEPEGERAAEALSTLAAEVAYCAAREAVRNAARHGRARDPERPLHLDVSIVSRDGLQVAIEDDGVGLDGAGASIGGSGQGLALHGTMMAVIGGTLTAESVPGRGTRVTLTVPRRDVSRSAER